MTLTAVPSDSNSGAKEARGSKASLQRAVLQLRSDYGRLVDDSQDVVAEAARALAADAGRRGRRAAEAALAEARRRPVTTAAIAIAGVSAALAAALSCREAARSRRAARVQ